MAVLALAHGGAPGPGKMRHMRDMLFAFVLGMVVASTVFDCGKVQAYTDGSSDVVRELTGIRRALERNCK